MNCTCINDIEQLLLSGRYKQMEISNAKIVSVAFLQNGNDVEKISCSELMLQHKGFAKTQRLYLLHMYCPFCGARINDEDDQIKNNKPTEVWY